MDNNTQQIDQKHEEKDILQSSWKNLFKEFLSLIGKLIKIAFWVIIAFSLLFHWMPDYDNQIFPKESISWSNTIIGEEDVRELIDRHNNAGSFERAIIRNEYIHRKLVEIGIIVQSTDED